MGDSRVSPYSLNDIKNTTDDALGNYLRGLQFKQDNSKLDFRLAVGYASVVIAAGTFVADYKLGWEATKSWTAAAVAAYAILNATLTYWMWIVEKGLVFEGSLNGKKISIASKTKKNDPTYYLTVTTSSEEGSQNTREIENSFTQWFTADGYLEPRYLQRWLASSIDMIGEADPKSAKGTVREAATLSERTGEAFSGTTGVDVGLTKASKRSKKKT